MIYKRYDIEDTLRVAKIVATRYGANRYVVAANGGYVIVDSPPFQDHFVVAPGGRVTTFKRDLNRGMDTQADSSRAGCRNNVSD